MNLAVKSLVTSSVIAWSRSEAKVLHRCWTGFRSGSTFNLCWMTSGDMPDMSSWLHAKTSRFSLRNLMLKRSARYNVTMHDSYNAFKSGGRSWKCCSMVREYRKGKCRDIYFCMREWAVEEHWASLKYKNPSLVWCNASCSIQFWDASSVPSSRFIIQMALWIFTID